VQAVLEITLPIFALVFCGYAGRRQGSISELSVDAINQFVFMFALPAMLFRVAATNPLASLLDPSFAAAWLCAALAIYAIAYGAGRRWLGGDRAQSAGWGLNAAHGNVGYMGLPLASEIGGAKAMAPILMTVILDVFVIITMTIVLLEFARQPSAESRSGSTNRDHDHGQDQTSGLQRVVKVVVSTSLGLLRSPLVLSIGLGLVWSATEWKLPMVVDNFVRLLGSVAGPSALFAIGASLGGKAVARDPAVPVMSILKIFVHPALAAVTMLWLFPVGAYAASIGVIAAALPAASNGFIIAQRYGLEVGSISSSIVIGTVISLVTVSFAVWVLPLP
jgi:predicted permease